MNKKLILSIFFTIVYAIITIIAVLHHEVWADEVQVWQICKHLSLPELFNQLHNEGHPALFYLIVYPFAKLTSNIFYMQLICWISMCFAVFLLLYKSPFNVFAKFSIVTSAGFLYFLPVMARNYAIIPVLMFIAAILYSKQKQYPGIYAVIVALIANTHSFMFAFAFILFVYFVYDNIFLPLKNKSNIIKENIISSVILLFGICTVIWQVSGSSSSNVFLHHKTDFLLPRILNVICNFFIKAYNTNTSEMNIIDMSISAFIAVLFFVCLIKLFKNKRLFALAFSSIGFQFLIYFFIYDMVYVTRIFLAFIILIFCLWVMLYNIEDKKNNKSVCIILGLIFLFTANNGLESYALDIDKKYSCAEDVAKYIVENVDNNAVILAAIESTMIPVAYNLEKENRYLMSAVRKKPLKYVVWDDKCVIVLSVDSWENCAKYYSELYPNSDIYVLRNISRFYDSSLNDRFETVYVSSDCIDKFEKYILYKFKKN